MKINPYQEGIMKKLLKIITLLIVVMVITVAVMAVTNVCPPQGPWPQPPWCPGSSIPWPFSDPSEVAGLGEETGSAAGEISDTAAAEDDQSAGEDNQQFDSTISENERLAQVAIGLVQDLSTVNSYFNDAASSIGAVNPGGTGSTSGSSSSASGTSGSSSGNSDTGSESGSGQIPTGFMDPLPASGYIPAPAGACAVGATPSASFLNQNGEKITPELLAEKDIQVINFDTLTGGSIDGRALQSTITSLITPGDQALGTPAGWNQKVWSQMAQYHTPAESLLDYHLWTVSGDIESAVVDSMRASLASMGLPAQVINALNDSQTSGWYAGSAPQEADKIAAMEIEAVFSGRTEGTIFEKRDFSLPDLGEMPQFGPMDGEGSVVYHDPDFGDYPFALEIEWTKWDELGRVTAGTIVFTDEEHDVVIEMTVNEDNSRVAHVFRAGVEVGIVYVDINGETTYEDLTE
jgi:hypothetical protein